MAKGEILGSQPHDPRAVGGGDVARAIGRSGIDQQDFEVAIPLLVERLEHFRQPALLVEGADQDGGFWCGAHDCVTPVRASNRQRIVLASTRSAAAALEFALCGARYT